MNWVLKTELEIEKEANKIIQKSRNPVVPLIVGLLCGLLTGPSLMLKFDYSRKEAFHSSLFIFVTVAIGSYIIQVIRKRRLFHNQTYLCLECYKSQIQTHLNLCQCGGKLLPIEYFNWIDST